MSDALVPTSTSTEPAFSCAVTAVMLARVRRVAGEAGVARLLRDARSTRTVEYLEDVGNWVGFDETIALWDAGEVITDDRRFARHVGEDGVKVRGRHRRRPPSSATSALVEEDIRRLNVHRASLQHRRRISKTVEVRPGYAEVRAVAVHGIARHRHHCEWTNGLMTLATALFGLRRRTSSTPPARRWAPPIAATTSHWDPDDAAGDESDQIAMLRGQLDSLAQRLEGVFATVSRPHPHRRPR